MLPFLPRLHQSLPHFLLERLQLLFRALLPGRAVELGSKDFILQIVAGTSGGACIEITPRFTHMGVIRQPVIPSRPIQLVAHLRQLALRERQLLTLGN